MGTKAGYWLTPLNLVTEILAELNWAVGRPWQHQVSEFDLSLVRSLECSVSASLQGHQGGIS